MMLQFAESGHPVFRGTLLLRTIIAVNLLSIYGTVTKCCNSQSPPRIAKPQTEQVAVRVVPSHLVTGFTQHETLDNFVQGDLVHKRDEDKKLPATPQLSKVCEHVGFTTTVAMGKIFVTRSGTELEGQVVISSCRESRILVTTSEVSQKESSKTIPGLVQLSAQAKRS